MNTVTVSADRRHMTITDARGATATLRSARPGGFTSGDEEKARSHTLHIELDGQVNRAWKRGRLAFIVNTGPPVWWLPRLSVNRTTVMVGWLKGLVAISYIPRREGDA